jgi:hypothetical protein
MTHRNPLLGKDASGVEIKPLGQVHYACRTKGAQLDT